MSDTLAAIAEGRFSKAVLARTADVLAPAEFDPVRVFDALREEQPGSFRYLVATGDGVAFVGASPERLVRLSGDAVIADSIAGTARRGAGPEEDARLAAALLASAKDRREHDAVAREIRSILGAFCDDVDADAEPDVLALRHVLHLRTRVRAAARPGTHVLDLVGRLHPTAAVAGAPRDPALVWIRDLEPGPRGWYAGPVGWISAAGDGDFAVALRCAVLRGAHARVYAGAGIVAGSDPEAEWRETELKMRPVLDVLARA